MEKFCSAWWRISPKRAMAEPNGEENKQLVPESYESFDKAGNGSIEDYRRVVSSIELRSLKDKTQVSLSIKSITFALVCRIRMRLRPPQAAFSKKYFLATLRIPTMRGMRVATAKRASERA